jgi:two-component system chemotaxis response regulator CheY
MKLLIVDDSNIIRKAIQKYVAEFHLEIVGEAPNGKVALDLFREKKPDLVTMDITMPEMDGLETLVEMQKLDPGPRIIIITALKDKDTALEALQKGAAGFLGKPFTETQLKEEMSRVIGGLK